MIKMQPIIRIWYDNLKEGKLTGLRCKNCGHVEFPPVPICRECSTNIDDMEWVEVDGNGTVVGVSYAPTGIEGYNDEPCLCVLVHMDNGTSMVSFLSDAGPELEDDVRAAIPFRVEADIVKVDEEVWWPAFRMAEALVVKTNDQNAEKTGDSKIGEDEFLEIMNNIFADLGRSVNMTDHMIKDLNASSLNTFMIVAELEERLGGKKVAPNKVKHCETVSDVYDLFCSML